MPKKRRGHAARRNRPRQERYPQPSPVPSPTGDAVFEWRAADDPRYASMGPRWNNVHHADPLIEITSWQDTARRFTTQSQIDALPEPPDPIVRVWLPLMEAVNQGRARQPDGGASIPCTFDEHYGPWFLVDRWVGGRDKPRAPSIYLLVPDGLRVRVQFGGGLDPAAVSDLEASPAPAITLLCDTEDARGPVTYDFHMPADLKAETVVFSNHRVSYCLSARLRFED